jgi:peptidoglycan hydrolase CwlO-like protein
LEDQLRKLEQMLGDPLRAEKTDALIAKVREGERKAKKLKKERNVMKTELNQAQGRLEQIKKEIGGFA